MEKYTGILQYDDYKMHKLFEEFIDFKSSSDSELLSGAWEVDDGSKEYRIDNLWYQIQQMRSLGETTKDLNCYLRSQSLY